MGDSRVVKSRRFPLPIVLAVIIGIVALGGAIWALTTNLEPAPPLPLNFSTVSNVSAFAPTNTEFFAVARLSVFEDVVTKARQVVPEAFSMIDSALTTITSRFGQMETLLQTSDWIGENAALALFPAETEGAYHFVLAAEIADRERALNALSGTVGVLSESQGIINGMTHYHLTTGFDLLVTDHLLVLSDSYNQLPTIANVPSLASNTKVTQVTSSLTFSAYDVLILIDTTSVWWSSLQSVFAVDETRPVTQPYFALAIAQPEPNITLIDVSQTSEGSPAVFSAADGTLLPFVPATSLAVIEMGNLKVLHDRVLESAWINEQLPGVVGAGQLLNQIVTAATTLDYRVDFVNQMTENVILFVDSPSSDTLPHALDWGSVIQTEDALAMRTTFDRAAFQLPLRAALVQPILANLFPALQFDFRVESLNGANAMTIDLAGTDDTADLLMTMLNNGDQLVFGNRYGVQAVMARSSEAFTYGRYLPYTLDNATVSMVLNVEALLQTAQFLSANGVVVSLDDISQRLEGVAQNLYIGMFVSDKGMELARLVVLQ